MGSYTLNDAKLEKRFKGSLPLEDFDWRVGAIVGRSGSGKTSIAKQLFPDAYIKGFHYKINAFLMISPKGLKPKRLRGCFAALVLLFRRIGSRVMTALARGRRCVLTSQGRSVWISH